MSEEAQAVRNPFWKKKSVWVSAACACALLLAAFCGVLGVALANENILSGVWVGEVDVGGLSLREAEAALEKRYGKAPGGAANLLCGDAVKKLAHKNIGLQYNIEKSAQAAQAVGRDGALWARLAQSFSGEAKRLPIILDYDETAFAAVLAAVKAQADAPAREISVTLEGDTLVIVKGAAGFVLNEEEAAKTILTSLSEDPNRDVTLTLTSVNPKPLDAKQIFEEYNRSPQDASYAVEGGKLKMLDAQPGISFTMDALNAAVARGGDAIRLSVTTAPAKLSKEALEASFFQDQLSAYSSNFSENSVNRSHNLRQACASISGMVLAPGDVFSYNGALGQRTVARGYKEAGVFVGNKVESGVGGGICQISSTLFNAVVLADLKIVTRTNHSMPVGYVPNGRDATVDWGSIDFKFENSTAAPIRLYASAAGGVAAVQVYGTKADPSVSIDMTTELIGSSGYAVQETPSADLPAGQRKVTKNGANALTYNTYKVTKKNGAVVKSEFLTRSAYVSVPEEVLVGTGAAAGVTPEETPLAGSSGENPSAAPSAAGTSSPSPSASSPSEASPTAGPTDAASAQPVAVPAARDDADWEV